MYASIEILLFFIIYYIKLYRILLCPYRIRLCTYNALTDLQIEMSLSNHQSTLMRVSDRTLFTRCNTSRFHQYHKRRENFLQTCPLQYLHRPLAILSYIYMDYRMGSIAILLLLSQVGRIKRENGAATCWMNK